MIKLDNKFDKVWMPRELKQKETIFFHIPVIKRPVTTRQLIYALPGAIIGIIFFLVYLKISPQFDIKNMVIRVMITIALPILFSMFSNRKENGLYLEEKFIRRYRQRTKSKVLLNKKSIQAMKKVK